MARIEITNLQDYVKVERKLITQIMLKALKKEGRTTKSLSVVLTDNQHLRDLTDRYMGHPSDTDVISFPLDQPGWPCDGGVNGEIIASAERAAKVAKLRGSSAKAELLLYLVHGLLHLVGYDDNTKAEAERMHETEEKLLEQFGFENIYCARGEVQ
ncbi:MAG: rRNA maturation RNase YbeY [Phycisphaerae bacterium]|nr:rRNA maturation RNase YbeY [Phycisphaerae bacterium]